jgi:hypothetical protein
MEANNPNPALYAALRDGLRAALGEKLVGVYVYGAAAFPDGLPTGDIDFHVILTEPLTVEKKAAIEALYAALGRDYPPLGAELDGYFILLQEARGAEPPAHQLRSDIIDQSWALHRAHILAGRCFVLYGPDPKEIFLAATWPELEAALKGELQFVLDHLHDYPDYCILNLCRLLYSFETGDVVISKSSAAAWAWQALPQWRRHIELAKKSYAGQAAAQEWKFMLDEVEGFYRYACQRIEDGLEGNLEDG